MARVKVQGHGGGSHFTNKGTGNATGQPRLCSFLRPLSLLFAKGGQIVLVAAALLTLTAPAWGQAGGSRPKARAALAAANDAFMRGDYEPAAMLLGEVQALSGELSKAELGEFRALMDRNQKALLEHRKCVAQIGQADEALTKGRRDEAAALLQALTVNAYLTPADKQRVGQLTERYRGGSAGGAVMPPVKEDARALTDAARSALQRGDIDSAEVFAHQAEKATSSWPAWLQPPWRDSPSRVLRDVQAARKKQADEKAAHNRPRTTEKPESTSPLMAPLQSVKNLFSRTPAKEQTATRPTPDAPRPGTNLNAGPKPNGDIVAAGNNQITQSTQYRPQPAAPLSPQTAKAIELVHKGREAYNHNDLATAKNCAEQAIALYPAYQNERWFEDNPGRLLGDIGRRTSANVPNQPTTNTQPPVAQANDPAVNHPQDQKPADPRVLVRESRSLLRQGKLDEADRLSLQAAAVPGTRWGLFEDSPERLRVDIQAARAVKNRKESYQVLHEAQKLFDKGDLKGAKTLAYRAKHLHGPYTVWERGDRADRLIGAIHAAEMKLAREGKKNGLQPEGNALAQKNSQEQRNPSGTNQKPADGLPAMAALEARQRARALVAEARALQREGKFVEARQRAIEGRRFEVEADKGGASLDTREDRPSQALLDLNSRCQGQIDTLVRRAEDCANNSGGKDPSAFQQAATYLKNARALALVFCLDTGRIDERMNWLQQMEQRAQGTMPPAPEGRNQASHVAVAGGLPLPGKGVDPRAEGIAILEKARLEFKAGQWNMARHMAEQVFLNSGFGLQDEARRFLNSIDAEENNQRHLAACRKFDEAHDAFTQHDYNMARTLIYAVDERLLTPDRLQRLREISALPEMQPVAAVTKRDHEIQSVGGATDKPGRASVDDRSAQVATPGAFPDAGGLIQRHKGMEKVLFDKMHQEALEEQRRAMSSAKAKDYDAAIDVLHAYLVRLDGSSLASDQVAMLRRPVERRIDEYRKLKAQNEWEKLDTRFPMKDHEKERTAALRSKQAEIEGMMQQCTGLVREHKYEEALVLAYKIRDLDPDSPVATMLIETTKIKRNLRQWNDVKDRKEDLFVKELNSAEDPGPYVDMKNPMSFDADAVKRWQNRKGYDKIESDRRGNAERKIEQRLLAHFDLNWKDTPLRQVIDDLHALAGINVVPDTDALREANVNLEQALSLKVEDMSLKSALNILLKQAKLTYVIKDEALQITTEEHAKGKLKMVTYPVGDLVTPVENHSLPVVYDLTKILERQMQGPCPWNYGGPMPWVGPNCLPVNGVASSPNSGTGYAGANGGGGFAANASGPGAPLGNPPKPTNANTIEDLLIRLITQTIEPNSWTDASGKGTIQYFPLGLALVINQTQDIQEQIQDLLQALRRLQDVEVAIEMRLVSVSEAFFERMAVDFDLNIMNRQTRYEPQLVTQQFASPGYLNTFQPSNFFSGLTPAGTFTPDLGVPINNSSYDFSLPPFGGYPGTLGADGGLTLGLAFLSDIQVYMLLDAAQGDRRYNMMQAPKITVFNGQTAFIFVSTLQYFLTQIQVIPFGSQLVFTPQNSPIPIGVFMTVTPVVSADRRFVRLNLSPSMRNLMSATVPLIPIQIPVNNLFNDNIASIEPTIFQTFFQQPSLQVISLNTTAVIPDGGTVLLGGMKVLSEGRNEFGPPVLSKIPYINRLFKNVGYGRETQSLMILVTARIIINEEEEQIYLGQLPPIPR